MYNIEDAKYIASVLGVTFDKFTPYEFLEGIPGIKHILMFIGKHSTNIFLIHTFIYLYFYEE